MGERLRKFRDVHKSERSITIIYLVLRAGKHHYGGFPFAENISARSGFPRAKQRSGGARGRKRDAIRPAAADKCDSPRIR